MTKKPWIITLQSVGKHIKHIVKVDDELTVCETAVLHFRDGQDPQRIVASTGNHFYPTADGEEFSATVTVQADMVLKIKRQGGEYFGRLDPVGHREHSSESDHDHDDHHFEYVSHDGTIHGIN